MAGIVYDDEQLQAIEADGHVLVAAGPGSGKTGMLAGRGARLLNSGPGMLAAVSFTQDSAKELRSRILSQGPDGCGRRVVCGTFHSLSLRMLHESGGRRARVINGGETFALLKRAMQAADWREGWDEAVRCLEQAKSTLTPPSNPDIRRLLDSYESLLGSIGAIDFGAMLLRCVQGLRDGSLQPISATWMLVDEAQDMDEVQLEWVKLHARAGVSVTMVGDDDQAVYGWRYSLGIKGMESFERDTRARRVLLQSNYRCAPEIVSAAGLLIVNNRSRMEKLPRATQPPGGTIELVDAAKRDDEAEFIVGQAKDCPNEWAVLARTNKLLYSVEAACGKYRVPYIKRGGASLWDSALAGAIRGMLVDIEQGTAARSIVQALLITNVLDGAAGARLEHDKDQGFEPILRQVESMIDPEDARKRRGVAVRELKQAWPAWVTNMRLGRVDLVIFGVAEWFKPLLNEDDQNVVEAIVNVLTSRQGKVQQRFIGLEGDKESGTGLRLLTMHAAKGLEFENCWVMACEEGICPMLDGDLEEERRLFYVAMTRAKRRLVLSRLVGDKVKLSRFLREAKVVPGL